MKNSQALLCLALLSLLPAVPLALYGYAGHDFRFHLASWMEMHTAWRHGSFAPAWSPLANYRLGDPHFLLYPPASLAVGTLLSFLLPFRFVPAAYLCLCTLLAGLCMYAVSGYYVADGDRPIAAVLFMFSPYPLLTGINRFAAAELLAMAWLPAILLCLHRGVWERRPKYLLWLGCLFGLNLITDIPESIVLFYVLGIVAAAWMARQRSIRPAVRYSLAAALGGALAAFHLAPAFVEKKWITTDSLTHVDFRNFFIFISPSRVILKGFQYGCWADGCVEVAFILAAAWLWWNSGAFTPARQTLVEVSAVAFVFQLPFTAILWTTLPELLFVQYSYRFLAVLAAAFPLALLADGDARSLRRPAYISMALLACVPFFGYPRDGFQSRPRPYPTFASDYASLSQGYRGAPEYLPQGAQWPSQPPAIAPVEAIAPADPAVCRVNVPSITPPAQPRQFTSDAQTACLVRLAVFFHPYWRAYDERSSTLTVGKTEDGLLSVAVPAGEHTVRLDFAWRSRVRVAGGCFSLLSALAVGLLGLRFPLEDALPQ